VAPWLSTDLGRPLVALALLAGCSSGGWEGDCVIDDHCRGSEVCARDRSCVLPTEVRAVRATWTVRGEPASTLTCAQHPDLTIRFLSDVSEDALVYAPVPCRIGQFTIDKLPLRYRRVNLGADGQTTITLSIPPSNTVMFDLVIIDLP
jgi:hypothetical protein